MNIIKQASNQIAKHSPEILTSLAVGGMVTTVVMAVKATPKALELIQLEHDAILMNLDEDVLEYDMPKKDMIKVAWKPYIPAMIMGTATIACIIGAHTVSSRRTAALASAYSLTETALTEYKNKVVEQIGKGKEEKVRDAIAADHLKENPISEVEILELPGDGQLCYDTLSSRYFKSSIEKIRQTVNCLNERLLREDYLSVNDLYYSLGLRETPLASDLGWRVDNGLIDVKFSAQLTETDTPCIVIDYQIVPQYY